MSLDSRRLIFVSALLFIGVLIVWSPAIANRISRDSDRAPLSRPEGITAPKGFHMFVADTNSWLRTPDQSLVATWFDFSTRGTLSSFPLTIGDWRGEDLASDSLQTLGFGPAQEVFRIYGNKGTGFLWLRLLAAADQKLFYHTPPICYSNNNWQLGPETTYSIGIGKTVLNFKGFVADQGPESLLVLYTLLWPDSNRSMAAGATLFELAMPVAGNRGAALKQMEDFTRMIFADGPEIAVGAADMQFPVDANFGDKVTLVGYDLSSGQLAPGETLTVTLAWLARRPLDEDYTAFVHLLNRKEDQAYSMVMAQEDKQPFGGLYPTSKWRAGQVVKDTYKLHIPDGAAAGGRSLEVGMYLLDTGQRLSVTGTFEGVLDDSVILQSVRIGGDTQ